MKLLWSVIFSLCVFSSWGQQDSLSLVADSLQRNEVLSTASDIEEDEPNSSKPLNFAIHVDYGKLLTVPFDFETKLEGGIVLELFSQIELVGEYGYWDKDSDQAIENGTYNSTGNYWRLGAGFSLPFNTPGNKIGIGFRYAESTFDDQGGFDIVATDGLTEPFNQTFSRNELNATWLSGVLTSSSTLKLRKKAPESKLNRLFQVGLQLRWRFLRSHDRTLSENDPIEVYTIPGFGRTLQNQALALNFFIRCYPFGL